MLLFYNSALAQTKENHKDTTKTIVTDTTALLTWSDFDELTKQPWFGEMPSRWADIIRNWLYRRYTERSVKYQKKQ